MRSPRLVLAVVVPCRTAPGAGAVDLSGIGIPYPGLRRYGTYILTLWLVTAVAAWVST